MKISSIIFFACLIQTIFSSTDDYYITVQEDPLVAGECQPDYTLLFYIKVITSGFEDKFDFKLVLNSYIIADCTVPPTGEGKVDYIQCVVNANLYPLVRQTTITLQETLTFTDITLENWEYASKQTLDFGFFCYPPTDYTFTQGESGFTLVSDEDDQFIFEGYGSFTINSPQNYLTSTDEQIYNFQPHIYSDNKLYYADCNVYVPIDNSADYKIHCAVKGKDQAVFFPTNTKNEEGATFLFNVYEAVDLPERSDSDSSSSFIKLTGFLLLCLLF